MTIFEVDDTFSRWQLNHSIDLVNPSFLLADSVARRLYTLHGDFGEISALSVDGTGRLVVLNQQPVEGRNPVHL